MILKCPHCKVPLKTKKAIINGVTRCQSCEKDSCIGSFTQWLAVAIAALIGLFSILIIFPSIDKTANMIIAVGCSLIFLGAAILVFVRPVKFEKKSH